MRAQAQLQAQRYEEALADCTLALSIDNDNAQLKALKKEIRCQAQAAWMEDAKAAGEGAGAGAGEEDPFGGFDTPKSVTGKPVTKVCMVCLDNDRGGWCWVEGQLPGQWQALRRCRWMV